jgi:hypothetical protein
MLVQYIARKVRGGVRIVYELGNEQNNVELTVIACKVALVTITATLTLTLPWCDACGGATSGRR